VKWRAVPGSVDVVGLDHVQLAMPPGMEQEARTFYGGVLGLTEVEKPAALMARGGCWFARGSVHVHLGVEPDFRPATKAHPALLVSDLAGLRESLEAAGVDVTEDDSIPVRRFYAADPFGNRIEFVDASDAGFTVRSTRAP
jgi:catechol 2,3-dioxygenase-like lactoylglutathione lyase family enzyme